MDRIVLSGMQFFGYHGTRPEETTLGQRFEVTVTVGLDLQAAATADIRSCLFMNPSLFEMTRATMTNGGSQVNDAGAGAEFSMIGFLRGKENNYFMPTCRQYVGEREYKQIYHGVRYSLGIPS